MVKIFILVVSFVAIAWLVFVGDNDTNIPTTINSEQSTAVGEDGELDRTSEPSVTGEVLDLRGKSLTETPKYVFDLTNLQSLDLSNNQLDGALQAEIRNLQQLRVLDLSDNNFTGVPAEIGQLKNLEVLDLSHNQLTGLPYELGNLSSLKKLDLRGNNYSKQDLEVIKQKWGSEVVILVD